MADMQQRKVEGYHPPAEVAAVAARAIEAEFGPVHRAGYENRLREWSESLRVPHLVNVRFLEFDSNDRMSLLDSSGAMEALGRQAAKGNQDAIDLLTECARARDAQPDMRRYALSMLVSACPEVGARLAQQAIDCKDSVLTHKLTERLVGATRHPAVVDVLYDLAVVPGDAGDQSRAMYALTRYGAAGARALANCLRDPRDEVRKLAQEYASHPDIKSEFLMKAFDTAHDWEEDFWVKQRIEQTVRHLDRNGINAEETGLFARGAAALQADGSESPSGSTLAGRLLGRVASLVRPASVEARLVPEEFAWRSPASRDEQAAVALVGLTHLFPHVRERLAAAAPGSPIGSVDEFERMSRGKRYEAFKSLLAREPAFRAAAREALADAREAHA